MGWWMGRNSFLFVALVGRFFSDDWGKKRGERGRGDGRHVGVLSYDRIGVIPYGAWNRSEWRLERGYLILRDRI